MSIKTFQKTVWEFYEKNKRTFPWRDTADPYKILVSEVMLQQTQTSRVVEKYQVFLKAFPTIESLAKSPQSKVLKHWQGLGYNRRALFLKKSAEMICNDVLIHHYKLGVEYLQTLPGIGPNTAGAIVAFAYNKPVVFIETNIRRVFIHSFFSDSTNVPDSEIFPLIQACLPLPREEQNRSTIGGSEFISEGSSRNPEGVSRDVREWYYALMDYGAYLAKAVQNPNRKSKHYTKQSKFEGSIRQTRGLLIKALLKKPMTYEKLMESSNNPHQLNEALEKLVKEGVISKRGNLYIID